MTVGRLAGTVLKSKDQIAQVLSNPTWNVSDLYKAAPSQEVPAPDATLVEKLLKQCGLRPSDYSPERQRKLMTELATQLIFVEHVSAVNTDGVEPLIQIGGGPDTEFSLDKAHENDQAQETKDNWNPTMLAQQRSGNFYVLNEGLRRED